MRRRWTMGSRNTRKKEAYDYWKNEIWPNTWHRPWAGESGMSGRAGLLYWRRWVLGKKSVVFFLLGWIWKGLKQLFYLELWKSGGAIMVADLLTEGSTSSHTMAGCIDLAPHRLTAGGGCLCLRVCSLWVCVFTLFLIRASYFWISPTFHTTRYF